MEKRVLKGLIITLSAIVLLLILSLLIKGAAIDYVIAGFFILLLIVIPLVLIAIVIIVIGKKVKSRKMDLSQFDQSLKRINEYIELNDAAAASSEYQRLINMLNENIKRIPEADMARLKGEGLKAYQKITELRGWHQ